MTISQADAIRRLNDAFRRTGAGGQFLLSAGINALPVEDKAAIIRKVQLFDAFNEANDPHGEHDFGSVEHSDQKVFFKIDYYDNDLIGHSEDAADTKKTCRVLTVMLPFEY